MGGVIGGLLGGGKGAAIGATGGAAIALYDNSRYYSTPDVACRAIGAQMEQEQPNVRQQEQPLAGPAANGGKGEFTLSNSTRFPLEVYDGEKYIGRMTPRENWHIAAPEDRYHAFALIPNSNGSLSKDETDLQPTDNGWTFTEPAVARGR